MHKKQFQSIKQFDWIQVNSQNELMQNCEHVSSLCFTTHGELHKSGVFLFGV